MLPGKLLGYLSKLKKLRLGPAGGAIGRASVEAGSTIAPRLARKIGWVGKFRKSRFMRRHGWKVDLGLGIGSTAAFGINEISNRKKYDREKQKALDEFRAGLIPKNKTSKKKVTRVKRV